MAAGGAIWASDSEDDQLVRVPQDRRVLPHQRSGVELAAIQGFRERRRHSWPTIVSKFLVRLQSPQRWRPGAFGVGLVFWVGAEPGAADTACVYRLAPVVIDLAPA